MRDREGERRQEKQRDGRPLAGPPASHRHTPLPTLPQALAEADSADEEFWGQDFFAEDVGDAEYETESSVDDVPDSDFDESEDGAASDDDATAAAAADKAAAAAGRRKVVKPPGYRAPRPAAPRPPQTEAQKAAAAAARAAAVAARAAAPAPPPPALRASTAARSAAAEAARVKADAARARAPRRTPPPPPRRLTQAELLAEAAATEVANLTDLERLLAREEEVKRRAHAERGASAAPGLRVRSAVVDGEGMVSECSPFAPLIHRG